MLQDRRKETSREVSEALRVVAVEKAGLSAMERMLAAGLGASFQTCIDLIIKARGRVIASGMGKSGHIARKFAATMASTGTLASFVHPAEASHGDLGMISPDDVVVAFSWSGETAELRDVVAYTRRFGIPLVAVTSNANSALGKASDVCLELPKVEEACPNGLAPTTSTTMQLVMADAIAVALLAARNFTPSDFQRFHPGGKLGAVLLTVADIMHAGDDLPIVRSGTRMSEAIVVMTEKRFGLTAVVDETGTLVGVLTDGDLRRSMHSGLLDQVVDEVMTRQPFRISPRTLAAEALAKMNGNGITALLVTESHRPIGVLHIHDLLRAGII